MRLNTRLLVDRRRELGLSQREMARQVGVGISTIESIETATTHDLLTLSQFERIGRTLAIEAAALLEPQHEETATSGHDGRRLAPRLGAILRRLNEPVPLEALSTATDSDQDTLRAGLDDLNLRLRGCGMTLRYNSEDGAVQIVPHAEVGVEGENLTQLLRATRARTELDRQSARIVYRVFLGTVTLRDLSMSNNARVRLGRLIAAGIINEPASETEFLTLTPEARESLRADVPPQLASTKDAPARQAGRSAQAAPRRRTGRA